MGSKANGNGNKFRVQSLALGLALAAPFGLYWALIAGLSALAVVFGGLIAAGMALTLWKG